MRRLGIYLSVSSLVLSIMDVSAQETVWKDTLQAAVKTDTRRMDISIGRLKTGIEGIRSAASPLGEGDPVRWVQGLPGVTTGADGTTSMYVRGGNAGNILFSFDGVPVYGYSHILGLTTVIPTDMIESATLSKGGYDGDESNFTSAHLRIVSRDPSAVQRTGVSVNNFLMSASAEGPMSKNLSYMVSARMSPLGLEYKAVHGMLPSLLGGLDNFRARVGDAYGKMQYRIGAASTLSASFLGSMDRYGFNTPDDSHEVMAWNNMIGLLCYHREGMHTAADISTSINHYGSSQDQDKIFRETKNHLSLRSELMEYGIKAQMRHLFGAGRFALGEGADLRLAAFAPGQIGDQARVENTLLLTGWIQAEYVIPERVSVKAFGRINEFRNKDVLWSEYHYKPTGRLGEQRDPEFGFSAKWNFARHLAVEVSYDKLVQYYHSLEGLPVGWSLDMIVPTGERIRPEMSRQGSIGISGEVGAHSFSLGGFHKWMENLVYYKYSQALFSGALAAWEDHVESGNGQSYGLEALYEYQKNDWYARVSYMLSRTTREGFPSFYDGKPFHARFDRRHVLNATASWKNLSATFILQSGNWENGEAETYEMPFIGDETWTADYYSGVNNYHMPTVIRLDLGYKLMFKTGPVDHTVNLGICNVTNHFNPFMLYFDTRTESWKEIALLPILPNFSYRIEF